MEDGREVEGAEIRTGGPPTRALPGWGPCYRGRHGLGEFAPGRAEACLSETRRLYEAKGEPEEVGVIGRRRGDNFAAVSA